MAHASSLMEKDDLSTTNLLPSHDNDVEALPKPLRKTRNKSSLIHILVFLSTLVLSNTLTYILTKLYVPPDACERSLAEPPTGVPSALSGLQLPAIATLLNSTFYDSSDDIFRRHASDETDIAWKELTQSDNGVLLVRREDAARDGINVDKHAYWDNEEEGLVGYPVGVEVVHQLHCLNLLRKNLYFNFDHTRSRWRLDIPQEYFELHIDHCVDFLRHRLMCTSDVGVVPLFWLGTEGRTTGDMSRMHTCRNYETVRQFVKHNGIAMPDRGKVKPKDGDYVVHDYI